MFCLAERLTVDIIFYLIVESDALLLYVGHAGLDPVFMVVRNTIQLNIILCGHTHRACQWLVRRPPSPPHTPTDPSESTVRTFGPKERNETKPHNTL